MGAVVGLFRELLSFLPLHSDVSISDSRGFCGGTIIIETQEGPGGEAEGAYDHAEARGSSNTKALTILKEECCFPLFRRSPSPP